MAYASITYTSASGTTFALTNSSGDPIPYLRQADIAVTVNGTLKTQGTDYTFNSAGTAIVLSVAVSGATVVISRTTDISDATVVYTAGSTLTAQDLNNADNQIRYGLQEFSDTYNAITTGTGDLSTLGGFIGSAEVWVADNAHAATTGAIDGRIDSKIDTALTTDVVAGDSLTITDNSPASGQITIGVTNASISTAKLVDASVTTAKIADGNVTTAKILDSNVTTAKIADSNVTTAKIADSAVTSAKIADGTIVASDLASDAVTTAKILDANVTTGKIADGAVTTGKLADSSVTSGKIADGTIVAGDLASDSVTTAKILDANVTTAKIADSAVTTGKIADSAVTAVKIADGVITSAKLNASTVVTAAEQSASTPDDTSFFTTSASDARYVNVTGDTMSGALAMGNNKITGLATPTVSTDASTKGYVDATVAAASIPDTDYGDITVTGTGTIWTIDNGVVTSAKIADGTIVDGDINASAAIAGTKISPDFGSQNTTTTGTSTAASFIPSSSTAPSNGVYLPAANSVAISTNGTGRLFVNSSGNVGVNVAPTVRAEIARLAGTGWTGASPVAGTALFIHNGNNGTSSGTSIQLGGGDTSNTAIYFGDSADADMGAVIYDHTSDFLAFRANNSERMRLDSSGRLGLGTSSPDRLLTLRQTGASTNVWIGIGNDTRTWLVGNQGSVSSNFTIYDDTANAARLAIDSSGRVGIGTTDIPSDTNLAVLGNFQSGFYRNVTSGNRGYFINIGAKTSTGFADAANVFGGLDSGDSTGYLSFGTRTSGSVTEKARIDSSGRLLVGTSSALSNVKVTSVTGNTPKLQLQGQNDSYSTSISVTNSSGSSYGPAIALNASKGTQASPTVVSDAGDLGFLTFNGYDGTNYIPGAHIAAFVDGTPGSNDMPGRLVFSTTADGASSPTERMVIKNDGDILFGNAITNGSGGVGLTLQRASGLPYFLSNTSSTSRTHYYFQYNGTTVGTIATTTTATAYNTSSDYRLKENVVPLTGAADRLNQLQVHRFNFIADPDTTVDGFIAHEAQAVVPECVTGTKDEVDDDGNPIYQGIDQSKLVPLLTAALQEALAKIETLEARLTAAGI